MPKNMEIGLLSDSLDHHQRIPEWRKQEDKLKTVNFSKHNLQGRHAKWPELEDEVFLG